MKPIKTLALLVLSLPATVLAGEVFECREPAGQFTKSHPVIVVATKNGDGKTGSIVVAGVEYLTDYRVEGFNRVWLFGGNDTRYQYSLVIEASGDAKYSDHGPEGESTFPDTQRFFCEPSKKKRR